VPSETHRGNLFSGPPAPETGERFEDLLRCRQVRIERILSSDQPDQTLYDQAQDEWVVLLQGSARLELEGEVLELGAGDFLFIPAHQRHRVLQTSSTPPCLWLAVHLDR
jgi:cupin 2 domain-containing protein